MHLDPRLLCGALLASSLALDVSLPAGEAAQRVEPALPQAQAVEPAQALLVGLDTPETLPLQGPALRHRTVAVRSALLADAAERGLALGVEPFPGAPYTLSQIRAEAAYGGGTVYVGRLTAPGHEAAPEHTAEAGQATISVFEDAVTASLRVSDRLLRIEPAGGGAQRVLEIDESRMPACGTTGERWHVPDGPADAVASRSSSQGSTKAGLVTNLPTIDILVAYTPQARAGQGSTNAMLSLINLAVSESNQGYANSDVNQRYRLVYTYETVGYTETGNFSTELNRFQGKTDGYMDDVHALRNQYGADACCLIVNGTQYCGISFVMSTPLQSFESSAFQVTARTCATGYYSFSHEFGHNFGSHHDKANGGIAYWPYGYGWRTANGAWRTVMAYAPGTRINYWSNPNKSFSGQVLGSNGTAENYHSLNNNAPVTSQWRCAVPANYCTSKLSSALKFPFMSWIGKPVSDGSGGFQARIVDALPNKASIVFYGTGVNSAPFQGGTLCVQGSLTRLPLQVTDGSGSASFPFPITQYSPGDEIYMQGWFRDPNQSDGTSVGLTDGLRVDVCLYNN